MMRELVFLLEERSAQAMLESLLPRMLKTSISTRCIAFEGKSDLENQMVRKLRGYVNPCARFIVMRDQDSVPDCKQLKQSLLDKCQQAGKAEVAVVRIACHELESFYLADLAAVETALQMNGLARHQLSSKFRAPDLLGNPSQELKILTKNQYQKTSGSREIGKHLDVSNQRSSSFKNLIAGIRRMEQELLALAI